MPKRHLLASTAIALSMLFPGAAFSVQLDYQVGIGVEHNDDVNLNETDPVGSSILIPSFGFTLNQQGSTIQASANGLFEYRDYLGGAFADEFRNRLAGQFNWTVLPQRLDLTVEDYLAEQPIDTLQPNTPTNLQQTNVFAVGPTLTFRLGSTGRGQAELRYINSYADQTDDFNTNRISAAFRAIKELTPSSAISANLVNDHVDFIQADAGPNYNRSSAFGRYSRQWARFHLIADVGYSWIRYSDTFDNRADPLARANLGWQLDQRNSFTLDLSHQISDAASGILETGSDLGIALGAKIPTSIDVGTAAVTAAPYIENRIGFGYTYQGARTTFTVAPIYDKLRYFNQTQPQQTGRGGALSIARRLSPVLTFGFNASAENISYAGLDRIDKTRTLQISLERRWSLHWLSRLEYTRYTRDTNVIGENGDQNIIFLGITYHR
ncbi:MAG: hypothetical protein WBW61_02310 [Rhodanobacteraceae bacterium]